MYLIVGLGNYEKKYLNNYHNLGFMAVDFIAKNWGVEFSKTKCKAQIAEKTFEGEKVILAKPQTFMNLSGVSVAEFVKSFKIPLENIIVIFDAIDIEIGTIRFKKDGSGGTHNGMKNIVEMLGSKNIPRIRIGAGSPNEHQDLADYVLSNISKENQEKIFPQFERVQSAVTEYISKKGKMENINK